MRVLDSMKIVSVTYIFHVLFSKIFIYSFTILQLTTFFLYFILSYFYLFNV